MGSIKIHSIIRSRRRTIALTITPDATLVVRAPRWTPRISIDRFIHQQRGWITKKIREVKSRPQPATHNFVDGEQFLYLGKSYRLRFADVRTIRLSDELIVPRSSPPHARALLTGWYKQQAKKVFTVRADFYAKKMGVAHRSVKISNASTRWGSCGHSNAINLNWRLIMAPLAILDYVAVHELAHIPHKHHGQRFWDTVATYIPHHKNARAWLRKMGHTLKI